MKINCTVTSISKCIIFHGLVSLEASGSKSVNPGRPFAAASLVSLEASGSKSENGLPIHQYRSV